MAGKTKERILEAALVLFSNKGYEGTNLQEIADSIGVVKSALYRHFESKEDLWNALIEKLAMYYEQRFGSFSDLPMIPKTCDEFKAMTLKMIDFTIHDEKIIKVRKLFLTEQFRNENAKLLATKYFNEGLESMFTKIFMEMIKNKSIKEYHPGMLSFEFTCPISSLIHLCDRQPEREKEVMRKIKVYIEHFISVYGIK